MSSTRARGTRRRLPLLVALGLLVATSPLLAQPGARLEGTWTATSAERDGQSAPDVVGHVLTFTGDRFAISRDGRAVYEGTYRTAEGRPAQIDFDNTSARLQGTWKGIYRLDGTSLRICDNAPDMTKPRPTAFSAAAGSGYVCVDFTRPRAGG